MTDEQLKIEIIEAEKYYQLACEKFTQRQYVEAINFYTKSIDACAYAFNPSALINRASSWLNINQFDKAIEDFNHPLLKQNELDTASRLVLNRNLAFAYYNTEKFDEAKKCYEKVLTIDPTDDDAIIMILRMKVHSQTSEQKAPHLNFIFKSSDHIRYEKGLQVSGPHGGAERFVKVIPNIDDSAGYIVTIENPFGTNMAPKQMKIVQQKTRQIILRGYGHNSDGVAFDNWGLAIEFENDQVVKCILNMHSADTQIEYLP